MEKEPETESPDPKPAPSAPSHPWSAVLVSAAVLSAWVFGYLDALWRIDWSFPVGRHWLGVHALYAAIGALIGLGAWGVTAFERKLSAWIGRKWALQSPWVRACFYGVIAAAAGWGTAKWTFSGQRVGQTVLGTVGPLLFVLALFAAVSLMARAVLAAFERERPRRAERIGSALAVVVFLGLVCVDMLVFRSLYERLHTLLEITAYVVTLCVIAYWLDVAVRRSSAARTAARLAGLAACIWALVALASAGARAWVDDALRHVWLDEVYAGRTLRRVQNVEAFVSDPHRYEGISMLRVERLKERYDIPSTTLNPIWVAPPAEDPELRAAIQNIRAGRTGMNVLIYYVDTLRYDVAHDPKIMPNVAAFSKKALRFSRAYAPGSDTLRSLPGLTGGNYHAGTTHDNDLCTIARRSEHESTLFIAKSARQFLAKLRPSFRFERTEEIADYPEGQDVWGYGADQPTASRIVDGALEYLRQRGQEKFFLWLFHFDQHNWRELNEPYLKEVAAKHGVPDESEVNWRYRTIATSIDAEFGRLLAGLDELGLDDNTIVLFVSDHGEGMGEGGFWVHSVFLWESLIHVPLLLRVPGLSGRTIDEYVSLVDVAPTLARYMVPKFDFAGYQGEDLIGYLVPDRPKRRLPILFSAALRDYLVRVGMLDIENDAKLVLQLEAALLEYYDLTAAEPDATNLAERHPTRTLELLSRLVRSPVFPRASVDFDLLKPKDEVTFVPAVTPDMARVGADAVHEERSAPPLRQQ